MAAHFTCSSRKNAAKMGEILLVAAQAILKHLKDKLYLSTPSHLDNVTWGLSRMELMVVLGPQ